jgi:hypothetical protein
MKHLLFPDLRERVPRYLGSVSMPSTVIERFTYDDDLAELVVTFRTGRIYAYHDVPADVAAAMSAAFAKGEFFNAEIRDRYRFTRLEPSADKVRKVTE